MTYTWDQIIAWLGLVLPLTALSWSAVQHVKNERRKQAHEQFEKFRILTARLGDPNKYGFEAGAIIYELREFPERRDYIERMFRHFSVSGPDTTFLRQEINETLRHLER
jgi:hypothetical protein